MQGELYFNGVDAFHPVDFYSPRNEIESLNSILSLITISISGAAHKKIDTLKALCDETNNMITELSNRNSGEQLLEKCTCHGEGLLLQWGKEHGLKTQLQIARKAPLKLFPTSILILYLQNTSTFS